MSATVNSRTRLPWRVLLVLILVAAAGLRFWSALGTQVREPFRGDAIDYVSYAYNLEQHGVYSRAPGWRAGERQAPTPDAFRPPGYPALLTLALDGEPDAAFVRRAALMQALLGSLTVLLAFLAGRLALGAGPALVVAAFVAISPHLIAHEAVLLSETLFTVAVAAVMIAGARALDAVYAEGTRAVFWAASFGIVLGLTALVRPTLEHLPWLLAIAAVMLPQRQHAWRPALVMLASFVAIVGAWKLRSLLATGAAGDSLLAVGSFVHGSYPDFMFEGRSDTYGYPYAFDPAIGEAMKTPGTALQFVADKFSREPLQMTWWYLVGKPVAFFTWPMIGGWREVFTFPLDASPMLDSGVFKALIAVTRGLHWPLVALGVAGAGMALRGVRLDGMSSAQLVVLRWFALLLLYVIALHIVAAPFSRYSIPFRPLLYVLAVYAAIRAGKFLVRT